MNLHAVGLQNLRRLTPPPLQTEPSPGIKTAVEPLWPKPWLRIPGASYSFYSINIIRSFIHRFLSVRSELWIHCQLCPSRGSQVGRDADKGAHELSFKGGTERTAMDATCCKLKEGPCMSQKRPLVCRRGGGPPRCKGKRGTQGQRLLASAGAAPVGSS